MDPSPVSIEQNKLYRWKEKIPVVVLGCIIVFLIFIILFALNYFNILHVYRVIPGFSYFPVYMPKVTPFPHDRSVSEKTLDAFLRKNINISYLSPSSKTYFHTAVLTQASWNITKGTGGITFDARLYPERVSNDTRYITIFAFPTVPVDIGNLHDTLASFFTASLFQTIPCFDDKQTKSKYCQQLTRIDNTRQIIGAQFRFTTESSASAQTTLLYFCELYQHVADNATVSCTNVH